MILLIWRVLGYQLAYLEGKRMFMFNLSKILTYLQDIA